MRCLHGVGLAPSGGGWPIQEEGAHRWGTGVPEGTPRREWTLAALPVLLYAARAERAQREGRIPGDAVRSSGT